MANTISSAVANRDFSSVLRKVRGGATYVVTSHGRPVARIVPFAAGAAIGRTAGQALFARLAQTPVIDIGPWKREELYEDKA